MLKIPEPRISEIEKELDSNEKTYLENGENYESDDSSSSENQETPETEPHSKASLQRSQSSIADNNGSPVKNSPLGDAMPHNVHLAELPKASNTSITKSSNGESWGKQQEHQPPRKSSLETIVEKKLGMEPSIVEPKELDDNQVREKEDTNDKLLEKGKFTQFHNQFNKSNGTLKSLAGKVSANNNASKEDGTIINGTVEDDDNDNDEADTTVRIVPQDSDSSSFPKSDLFKMIEGDDTDLPQWFKGKNSRTSGNSKNSKPYTTVLNKDIDNSKPDPRNIFKGTLRSVQEGCQLLAGAKKNEVPQKSTEDSSSAASTDDESESGNETDFSSDDDFKRKNMSVPNNGPTDISLHSLKGSVVPVKDAKIINKEVDEERNDKRDNQKKSAVSESSVTNSKISEQMAKSFYPNSNKKQNEATKVETKPATQASSFPVVGGAPSVATKGTTSFNEEGNRKNVKTKAKNESAQIDRQQKETTSRVADLKSANIGGEDLNKKAEGSKEPEKASANIQDANDKNNLKEKEDSKSKQVSQKKLKMADHLKEGNVQLPKPSANDKLKDLKAKFTNSKTLVPPGIISNEKNNSSANDDDSSSSGSSTEDESSSSSSSSDEETSTSKKARRVVVNTPREPVRSSSKIEAPSPSVNKKINATPDKIPVTQLMDMSSPPSVKSKTTSNPSSILHDLPRKVRPSLSSLSDLVSRGIPDVKEKTSKSNEKSQTKAPSSSDDESSSDSDSNSSSDSVSDSSSDSKSESDSDDSGDSSDDGKSFISEKSASAALGKKKKPSGGFASLIKDFKKK
ncbi:CLL_collapsed_G0029260.mRNA.1.CDS.1 [Saccharomyces cerevisiae]|nr:CLL_collapsed_G0029260.mRNA.1.CDS.1 [Saccharomyces cerevisiae]